VFREFVDLCAAFADRQHDRLMPTVELDAATLLPPPDRTPS
jgi:hypothetical protein